LFDGSRPIEGRRSQPHEARAWAADADAAAHTFTDTLDDAVEIGGADGHHLQRVRRLQAGERVTVADGAGSWRPYVIEAIASGVLQLRAEGPRVVEPELLPRVSLALALTKAGALDTVVARCTELGVARVTPIRTQRSVVRWDAGQAARAVERLRTTAREAAAQSRRARLPEIAPVADLSEVARRPGVVVADRGGASVDELPVPDAADGWTVVVGPEGGLDSVELARLGDMPHLGLGPFVLKAETAPIAAVALLTERAGRLCREWKV
jgi:16S rRNA (uracil1498-N3)-methyltransferase